MTTDFRALCAELLRELEHATHEDYQQQLKNRARAALRPSHIRDLINKEFTPSEQEAILVAMADAVGDGRKYEIYREPRNGKDVLMVRVHSR